ncbi:MAG: DUF433 domain-containing protein [Tabrizicola sp.]|nr:DUF433 domain-containing protein [Tabrizicola sp.]
MSEAEIIGAFSEYDAARLSGLTQNQIRLWDRTGFFQPSLAEENRRLPFSRVYSFRDIVSLRVLGQLRNAHKVPLQHLRKVSDKLHDMGEARWTATTLYVLGKRVVFTDPRDEMRKEIVSEQRVFDIPLRIAISDTRQALARLNERDQSETGHVVQQRFVMQGDPVFDGTRIPVAAVLRYLEAGHDAASIIRAFPDLTAADIEAARSYQNGTRAA